LSVDCRRCRSIGDDFSLRVVGPRRRFDFTGPEHGIPRNTQDEQRRLYLRRFGQIERDHIQIGDNFSFQHVPFVSPTTQPIPCPSMEAASGQPGVPRLVVN
jgi:hypothetical protein